MINKKTETYAVVIRATRMKSGYYKIQLGDATGEVYELMVHEESVLDHRLIEGKELDQETVIALQNSKAYQASYRYAIQILSRKMYTEKEIRRKLARRETAPHVIDEVIVKLIEIDVLNDASYARLYVENQIEMGKKSKSRIISDLYKKGISEVLIDDLMDLFNQELERTLMVKEIECLYQRYTSKGLSDFEVGHQVVCALGRKGFDFDEAKRQYRFFIEDLNVEGESRV